MYGVMPIRSAVLAEEEDETDGESKRKSSMKLPAATFALVRGSSRVKTTSYGWLLVRRGVHGDASGYAAMGCEVVEKSKWIGIVKEGEGM